MKNQTLIQALETLRTLPEDLKEGLDYYDDVILTDIGKATVREGRCFIAKLSEFLSREDNLRIRTDLAELCGVDDEYDILKDRLKEMTITTEVRLPNG